MEFLERDDVISRLGAHLGSARDGSGRVVVLRGEAGIGKTSVVNAFCDEVRGEVHLLRGTCDDLITPQPLGPIWDMASDEPDLEDLLRDDKRYRVFQAMLELLKRSLRPTIVVIEDVHWADEATIDLIAYLGRRVDQTHGLLLLTYREDASTGSEPVILALGSLPHRALEQIQLSALSVAAVSQLADDRWDAVELWRITNGNPFFVTELIQAGLDPVPLSIRDAVGKKLLALGPEARRLAETISIVPGRVDLRVVTQILEDVGDVIEECERLRVLEVEGNNLAFRHELARRAVADGLAEIRKRELSSMMLRAVEECGADLALRAHLAQDAGDTDAMVRLLPLAARRSAELGSHREALSHLRALRPLLDQMNAKQVADHFELWAREEHLIGGGEAVDLVERAIRLRRQLQEPACLGQTLLLASDINWWAGHRDQAVEFAEEAASVLEPIGGEDLAMAYSTLSRWAMVASDYATTLDYAEKALNQLDDDPSAARVSALNNRGMITAQAHYPEGLEDLEESYRLAEKLGLPSHQGRAAANVAVVVVQADRDLQKARHWQGLALSLLDEAEMPGLTPQALTVGAWVDELGGEWARAEAIAREVLDNPAAGITQGEAASVLARILVRKGHSQAEDVVLDAWIRVNESADPHRLALAAPVALEAWWLGISESRDLVEEITSIYKRHLDPTTVMLYSETAFWLSALGEIDRVPDGSLKPFVLLDSGEWSEAAQFWNQRGIPYEEALALSFGDPEAKFEALSIADRLGALPLAERLRTRLRAAGVTGVPRGPSRATRDSPLGLTPRQTEVLGLLAEDLTNSEIAERLFVSIRTVENHVSAIISKLGARDRVDAVEIARGAQGIDGA